MPDNIVSIEPSPPLHSPEREAEIYESSRKTTRSSTAKTADQAAEIQALRARVERLERLIAPRRPADVIGNAVKVMRIATGETEALPTDDAKDGQRRRWAKKGARRGPRA